MMAALPTSVVVALAAGAAFGAATQAALQPAASIAYVSSQRISAESLDGKAGVARVLAMRRELADRIQKLQEALNATTSQLPAASGEAARLLREQEQRQRAELQHAAVQSQNDLQRFEREQSAELLGKVKVVLGELSGEQPLQLVLNAESAVVWGVPTLDLTSTVIERMNAGAARGGPPQ
jgi:Skp family chaperone for outer membrane proteins